ncbi:Transposon Ty3-G Gag-Pol polyprotein [Schistosoma haematobium]|uniref:Transposon Ty3-G Gag-Pol polyprotein n=1 Tax=Schistosoma haematobium TaxID=6185 RepID=A0A922IPL8_SCHHA|nr:Transposon Ty3-G Gag-Pol polyprotein [Schistosoma haematobium]KAH9583285.1 Transposon Ty3-G Gag-Pol polyprotein [Schistosoma haematobium]
MLKHQVSIHMDKSKASISGVVVHLQHHEMPTEPVAQVGISEIVRQVQDNQIISEKDRRATIDVLQQFSSVFSGNVSGNRTTTVQHSILTGDYMPLRQPPRRVPVHYQPQLESMIREILEKKIIVPHSSPWASPIVLVRKKDSSLRLCIDSRRPNAITKRDSFPLPRIDATLDAMKGACWFSALDPAS